MFEPTNPCNGALDPQAETRMGDRAVFSEIEIPFKRSSREIVFFKPL
jgi:hypothetical protein